MTDCHLHFLMFLLVEERRGVPQSVFFQTRPRCPICRQEVYEFVNWCSLLAPKGSFNLFAATRFRLAFRACCSKLFSNKSALQALAEGFLFSNQVERFFLHSFTEVTPTCRKIERDFLGRHWCAIGPTSHFARVFRHRFVRKVAGPKVSAERFWTVQNGSERFQAGPGTVPCASCRQHVGKNHVTVHVTVHVTAHVTVHVTAHASSGKHRSERRSRTCMSVLDMAKGGTERQACSTGSKAQNSLSTACILYLDLATSHCIQKNPS